MKCPRCIQIIHQGASCCPHCGFTLENADKRFSETDRRLHRIEDRAGLMRSTERTRVGRMLHQFEARFPQLFLAVYTARHEGRSDIRQLGFWLLNRGQFLDIPEDRAGRCGIILTIDPDAKVASMTWGYTLDAFLNEKDSFLILSRAHAYWVEGRFGEGIQRVIEQLALVLMKRARHAKRNPARFERKVLPQGATTQRSDPADDGEFNEREIMES
ncbi:hypothetical protein HAHE_38870 [Haloferula helveola]|uniref:TPM domain-containing protein n=1 Tax=Haloferula helveola TaxID=490095 RepID=A0ABN6HER8_9BACT|nr:hypothetical protein HAHE_38870 [Haloferula helveola]